METIKKFNKKILNEAKSEVEDERAFAEKQKAKRVLKELLMRKDFAEEVLKEANGELDEVNKHLKEFNKK